MSKKKFFVLLTLFPIVIALLASCSHVRQGDMPKAMDGIIDLSNWSFSNSGSIRLDGQWEFYWQELLYPDHFKSENDHSAYIEVPDKWNDFQWNNMEIGGEGFATYRLLIHFSNNELNTKKALFIPGIYTAYDLWIDGQHIQSIGKVNRHKTTSKSTFQSAIAEFQPTNPVTEIIIHVSNYEHYKGGISKYILLGNESAIDQIITIRQGIEGFTVGGLVLIGVYHFALFTVRREDPTSLYFSLFCLVFGIYTVYNSLFEFIFFSLLGWNIAIKLEYLSVYAIGPLFLLYLKNFYPNITHKFAVKISVLFFIPYTLITLLTPSAFFTKLMSSHNIILVVSVCYFFFVLLKAVIQKLMGAKLILLMSMLFFVSAIHDVAYYYNQSFFDVKIASLVFLFFIGAHSYVLSMRFAKAFREVEELTEEIVSTQKEIIYTLGNIAEERSKETGNHVKRVAEYSVVIGEKLGLSEKDLKLLKLASPMHDVGKVAIPDLILNKPGKLTYEEFETMKTHTTIGYEMLKHSSGEILQCAAEIALTHHERWDGTGYPRGLKGEEIPIFGRITAVADVFDALGSPRVYKHAWNLDDILEYFKEQKGYHFDPKLVDILLDNIEQFLEIREKYSDFKSGSDSQTA